MSQISPVLIYGGLITAVLSGLLLVGWAILSHHAGSAEARKQAARILAVVVLYITVFGSLFMMLSVRELRTEIDVRREYQDEGMDAGALEVAETFDYTALMGPFSYGTSQIFPPYPYVNETQIAPFIRFFPVSPPRPDRVSYHANITHPGGLVNVSAMMHGMFWEHTYIVSMWSRENGSWVLLDEGTGIVTALAWLVEIEYAYDADSLTEVRLIVGMNASSDVVLAIRGESCLCALTASPLPVLILLVAILSVVSTLILIEVDRSWQAVKKPPRHVTRDNLMENDTRVAIIKAVHENPGLTFSTLKRLVPRSPRTLLQQLGILQRFGLVRSREIRHNTALFDASSSESIEVFHYFTSSPKFGPILKALKADPGISFVHLQQRLNEPRSTLMRKIKTLEQYKLVFVSRVDGELVGIEPR